MFDKDRIVKGCRYNSLYNWYLGYMTWRSFLEISAQKDFGKTFKNIRRIFFAFLKLEKMCNLVSGLSICEVPAQSVHK